MSKSNAKASLVLISTIFFLLGLTTAALGPVLPELAEKSQSSLSSIGAVFTAIFLGALVSQLASGPLSDRIGQRRVLFAGLLLIGVGVLGFTLVHSYWLILGLAFFAGLGHGAIDLSGNVLISRVYPQRSAVALNLVNFFYGLGAFAGPAAISLILYLGKSGLGLLWGDAAILLLLAPFMIKLKDLPVSQPDARRQAQKISVYRSGLIWLLSLLILTYVGVENGMGGWITTYMNRTTALNLDTSALITSGFWLALTFGRLFSVWISARISPERLLFSSLCGALVGGMLFALTTGSTIFTILAIFLTGFSFGSVYPTVMAIITSIYRDSPGKAVGVAASMGSIGGMLIPWIQGILLEQTSPSASAWFSAVGIALMLGLFLQSQRSAQPKVEVNHGIAD
jgi:fucose permease